MRIPIAWYFTDDTPSQRMNSPESLWQISYRWTNEVGRTQDRAQKITLVKCSFITLENECFFGGNDGPEKMRERQREKKRERKWVSEWEKDVSVAWEFLSSDQPSTIRCSPPLAALLAKPAMREWQKNIVHIGKAGRLSDIIVII